MSERAKWRAELADRVDRCSSTWLLRPLYGYELLRYWLLMGLLSYAFLRSGGFGL